MSDNLFAATNGTPDAGKTEASLLTALVGETQKYKSVEDLAKAYVHADSFIEQLKEENRKLKEAQAQAKTLEDVLNRINEQSKEVETTSATQGLDQATVATLVEKTVMEVEQKKTREQNLLLADKLMKEKFGDKAVEVYKAKAATPNMQKIYMELASVNPQEFLKLFDAAPTQPGGSIDTGTRTTTIDPSAGQVKEWSKSWVANIRKTDPARYYSSEFQFELQKTVANNPDLYFGR